HQEELNPARTERLTNVARLIRRELARNNITGPRGEEITDVALFGPPQRRDANSKNFVLRSGNSYRRAPGGTATSAKLACLYADGALAEGQMWRQESIIGTIFDGSVKVVDGAGKVTSFQNSLGLGECFDSSFFPQPGVSWALCFGTASLPPNASFTASATVVGAGQIFGATGVFDSTFSTQKALVFAEAN